MKLHSLVLAAALSGMFGSALAGTFDLDLVAKGSALSTDVGNDVASGTFTDTFTFSGYSGAAGIAAGALLSTPTNLTQLVFTSATLNGISLDVGLNAFGMSTVTWDNVGVAGPLTLVINGTVTGKGSAVHSYGGHFDVTSAVPEPATYGMLAGGMGVLAFAARRRKG